MPVARFEMPDGRIGRFEVPEGTTPEQAQSMIEENLGLKKPEEGNFFQRVGKDFGERVQTGQKIEQQYKGGEISFPTAAALHVGNVGFGTLSDIGGEATKSAMTGLGKLTTQQVRDTLTGLAGSAIQAVEPVTKPIGEAYSEFERRNPVAGQAVRAAGNVANVGLMALGAPQIEKVAAGAYDATKMLGGGLKKTIAPPLTAADRMPVTGAPVKNPAIEPEVAKGVAQDLYRASEQYGGTFNQNFNQDISKTMLGQKIESPFAGSAAEKFNKDVDNIAETFKTNKFSIEDYDALDSRLNDEAFSNMNPNGTPSVISAQYSKLKDALRERVLTPKPGDIDDPAAFEAARRASAVYSDYFKLKDIATVLEKARDTDNQAQAIRTGIKNLRFNAKKTLGLSDADMALLEQGSATSIPVDVLRLVSSKLNSIAAFAAAGGGVPGAVSGGAMYGVGKAAAKLAARLQAAPVRKLQNIIGKRISETAQKGQEVLKEKPNKISDTIKGTQK